MTDPSPSDLAGLLEIAEAQYRAAQADLLASTEQARAFDRRIAALREARHQAFLEGAAHPALAETRARWHGDEIARLTIAQAACRADQGAARARLVRCFGRREALARLIAESRKAAIKRRNDQLARQVEDLSLRRTGDQTS